MRSLGHSSPPTGEVNGSRISLNLIEWKQKQQPQAALHPSTGRGGEWGRYGMGHWAGRGAVAHHTG